VRTKGSARELEKRRFDAIRLLELGYGPTEVGRILQADRRTVQRWNERFRDRGPDSLRLRPHPGPRPKLSEAQREELVRILLRGPLGEGYGTQLWTGPRVIEVIRKHFGLTYHPRHIGRVLHALGFSCQRPARRAHERDDRAIRRWVERDWRRIKKGETA